MFLKVLPQRKNAPKGQQSVASMESERQNKRREKLEKLAKMVIHERTSVRKAADAIGVSHMTAYRMLSEIEFNSR